ncbi:hypothetical protein BDN72DRAFT_219072 [Pluteus cervinus]|uniref:Uncharacterized protein n=1 Tax=Pluteus cervinus TaxID=181527 RepID=A0ACD3AJH7_9AGAR|nr:hypothetical protein BDN72DRAFT_219072 [Pluteus cervinus]
MSGVDVERTFGALFLGGLFATMLTGIVLMQGYIYYKLYVEDTRRTKLLVLVVCFLDCCHTTCIWSALWGYLIRHFGDEAFIGYIRWDLAATVVITALLTILVHLFYAHRIFLLSKGNQYIVIPLLLLIILRFTSATTTTAQMVRLGNFSEFKHLFRWLFTFGLALSSVIDVIITTSMFILLRTNRSGVARVNKMIDSLILYAFEMGLLTSAGTIASMMLWLVMPTNLIFMGLHFVIAKFYANSILVSLNTRHILRQSNGNGTAILFFDANRQWDATGMSQSNLDPSGNMIRGDDLLSQIPKLQVRVVRSIMQEDCSSSA